MKVPEMITGGITRVDPEYTWHDSNRPLTPRQEPPRLHFVARLVAPWELTNAKLVEGIDWIRGQHVDDADGAALLAAHRLARSAA